MGARERIPDTGAEQQKVLHWINSAKGIGVLLVIVGHFLYYSTFPNLNKGIYAFHMPLFFILSGYVQKGVSKGYLGKRIRKIFLPYLAYVLLSLPVYAPGMLKKGTWMDVLTDSLFLNGQVSNRPVWFLAVFFELALFCALTKLPDRGLPFQIGVFALSALGGGLLCQATDLEATHILGWNRTVICLSFFTFGLLLRRAELKPHWLLLLPCVGVWAFFGIYLNEKASLYSLTLGNYLWFFLSALAGSCMVMLLSRLLLNRPGWLTWLSRYAILFLGTQYMYRRRFLSVATRMDFKKTLTYNLLMIPVMLVYVLLLPVCYDFLKKRLPFLKVLNGEL